jgi:hypothetical protein
MALEALYTEILGFGILIDTYFEFMKRADDYLWCVFAKAY